MGKNDRTGGYKKNDIVRLEITDMSTEGMGVGKADGYALFVKDAITGDVIDARITKVKKNYGYARLEHIIESSPDRVVPVCSCARQCGGCQLQAMSYEAQLRYKSDKVRNDLIRIGGFDAGLIDGIMEPIIGMDDPWHYRNKAQYPVGTDKNGNPVAGFYAGRTHDIISNTDCALGVPENKEILEIILEHMKKYGIPAYDERNEADHGNASDIRKKPDKSSVRHILIRKGFNTGEIMVCLVIMLNNENRHIRKTNVTDNSSYPGNTEGDSKSVKVAEEYIPGQNELINEISKVKGVKSISVNINNKNTNVIMGTETYTLWGSDRISDILLGKRFEISPLSFYQVNPVQTEKLYSTAVEFAGLTGNEEVWDICCGIGTISLCMADKAGQVHGIEIVPEAIEDARKNAAANNIDNVDFICAAAEEYLPEYVDGKLSEEGEEILICTKLQDSPAQRLTKDKDGIRANVVVLDPPRKGMDESALEAVTGMSPERIVYVSCDPATLARDLKYLCANGYELRRIRCTDMFPQTVHVETCCLLERLRNAKDHVTFTLDREDYYRIKDAEADKEKR